MPACAHTYRDKHIYNLEKMSFSKNVSKSDVEEQERHYFALVKIGKKTSGKVEISYLGQYQWRKHMWKASVKCLSQCEMRFNVDCKREKIHYKIKACESYFFFYQNADFQHCNIQIMYDTSSDSGTSCHIGWELLGKQNVSGSQHAKGMSRTY